MHVPPARSATCTLLLPSLLLGAIGTLLPQPSNGAEPRTVITFERARPGTVPRGFRAASSNDDQPGLWQVTKVDGRMALSQTAIQPVGYRLALLEAPTLDNIRAGVRLRVDQGDRAAGLAWRVRDTRNYYAARIDFQDREFILHKFVNGNRVTMTRVQDVRLSDAAWHDIVIEHAGNAIRAWLNGIPVASERDDSLPRAGMLALWMPGDSTAHFERLWYEPLDRTPDRTPGDRSTEKPQAKPSVPGTD